MRWCPRCGHPKEHHDKKRVPLQTRAGMVFANVRECLLEDATEEDDPIRVVRADRRAYLMRAAADAELRSL